MAIDTEEYESLENWASRIWPQVVSCPRELVLDAIQKTAVEFFKEARVWLYEGTQTCENNKTIYPNGEDCMDFELEIPDETEIVDIESVRVNGTNCCKANYMHEGRTLLIRNIPAYTNSFSIVYEVWLRPRRYCTQIRSDLLEEYGDIISYGALAHLKMMRGEKETVAWSDPETAKNYYELYKDGINKAKIDSHIKRGYGMAKPVWKR
ncbi:MAG: hypothetical protein IJU76_08350 [Desulfovibrionaceae bacterium]|nr:hypothetical protein [Desulfovibrionaceae bacterium]